MKNARMESSGVQLSLSISGKRMRHSPFVTPELASSLMQWIKISWWVEYNSVKNLWDTHCHRKNSFIHTIKFAVQLLYFREDAPSTWCKELLLLQQRQMQSCRRKGPSSHSYYHHHTRTQHDHHRRDHNYHYPEPFYSPDSIPSRNYHVTDYGLNLRTNWSTINWLELIFFAFETRTTIYDHFAIF